MTHLAASNLVVRTQARKESEVALGDKTAPIDTGFGDDGLCGHDDLSRVGAADAVSPSTHIKLVGALLPALLAGLCFAPEYK
jgi:hypothetical protein